VEGFSGCPSALELAALWGLDLEQGRKDEENQVPMMAMMMDNFGMQLDSWVLGSNELIVPSDTTFKKRGSCGSSCGRYKQVLCKQLEELLKSGVVGGDGDDGDRDRDCDREGACDGDGDGEAGEGLMVPEMSERLKWSRDVEEINGGGGGGVNQQWNATTTNPSGGQSSQVLLISLLIFLAKNSLVFSVNEQVRLSGEMFLCKVKYSHSVWFYGFSRR
jgi:hypothetical protein